MADQLLDVVGIGNAIVDVLAQSDDAFLKEHDLVKGAMTLVDAERSAALYDAMGPGVEASGGSAGNTMAGIASLGGRGGYIGKVRDDQLGRIFQHDIRAVGIEYNNPLAAEGPSTGRCLIMVTPDAQRTMNTFLGAAVDLGPQDLDLEMIRRAKVTYMEGYLWDMPPAKAAYLEAAAAAHAAGRKVSLTLSDSFCVERHRDSFLELISGHVDLLFANHDEICALFQVDSFEDAMKQVRGHCEIAAITRGERGSVIVSGDETVEVEAESIEQLVDTTGAGDLYAAGFLYGYTQGKSLYDCGRIASIAAAEVISHFGARPATPLAAFVKQRIG
ncbi:adenosine kinase [Denitrobaculum tricleocarpae]|uniref:Adenosine kinase n=1 Tax=Denitrobaculum tricleocarpae TaxID=2591009 RepID=A0A545TRN7_9PROT|nr:adenosine kinase [Denitrobaculum tricleocarpae]TQV79883.1 adenosine kinase [Denitrobaculum tricleocarpae]